MTDRPDYCRRCRRYMTAAEIIENWHRCEEIPPSPTEAPKAKSCGRPAFSEQSREERAA
jgi:hypothetical protein